MLNPNINNVVLSEEEYILYSKHLIIDTIGLNGQKRLKQARILLIGAGGLGCPASLYLTTSGVGYIGIVDYDYIDKSNLNRQILYRNKDVNQLKVICAKKQLEYFNHYCKIIIHKYKLNKDNAFHLIQYYDIILDATDNFTARYIIDDICCKLHKIHIYGAIQLFESQVSVLNYKNSISYSSIYSKLLNLKDSNCNHHGTLGVITGYTAILQVIETIKIILGIGEITYNELLISNLLNRSITRKKIEKSLFYAINSNYSTKYHEYVVSKMKFYYFKKSFNYNIVLIDIRDNYEFISTKLRYSINIPLNKFKYKKTIVFLQNSIKKKIVFIYCSKMYRSFIVSKILDSNYISHYILK